MHHSTIRSLLTKDYHQITEDDYSDLLAYFKADKTNFYTQEPDKPRVWKNKKVDEFWGLIRRYAMIRGNEKGEFDFTGFIFPTFNEENFWEDGQEREFANKVIFTDTNFLGFTFFENVTFAHEALFDYTFFDGTTRFFDVKFKNLVTFNDAIFIDETLFAGLELSESINFSYIQFENDNIVIFENFQDLNEDDDNNNYYLDFSNVRFTSNVEFKKLDLQNLNFEDSDVSELDFKDCNWGHSNRINLKVESASIYRQLKKKFENHKHWELAGKAYVSEMKARQEEYRKHFGWMSIKGWNARLNFTFFWIYGFFGLYTYSFVRPFLWFGFLTVIFFPLTTYSDPCFLNEDCVFDKSILKLSIRSAMPFYRFQGDRYFLGTLIQKIICTILLTFFVLALRKRFKQ